MQATFAVIMDYVAVFDEVEKDFGKDVAILTNVFLTINLTLNPTMDHLTNAGTFTKDIIKIARETLWGEDEEQVSQAEGLWQCICDWNICRDVVGLGGCKTRSLKEIYDEKKKKKTEA